MSVSGMERLLEGGRRDGLDVEKQKQRIRHKRVQKPWPAGAAGLQRGSQLCSCVHCGSGDLGEQVNVIMDYERVCSPSPSAFSDLGLVFSLPIGLEFWKSGSLLAERQMGSTGSSSPSATHRHGNCWRKRRKEAAWARLWVLSPSFLLH